MGRLVSRVDWIDFTLLTLVGAFGLFILLSINQSYFYQQLGFMLVALVIGIVVAFVDASILLWAAPYGYIVSLIFLIISYVGPVIRGATRWIIIGPIQLQPSELVKPLLILFFAWSLRRYPPRSFKNVLIQFGLFAVPFIMILRQPDLGSSIVLGVIWCSMMIAAGFPIRYVLVGGIIGILFLPLVWRGFHDYQKARIYTFINPATDPRGTGYNAIQAMIAVGSGQLFGRGLGLGTQSHLRFLPEYHTDFIFATLVEELGFIGGALLLFGYGVLLWRIVMPLVRGVISSFEPFVYSVGLFSMILCQIVINAGMNMGIIPITGITLPFVSYGGSSLLSLAISYGFLWSLRTKARKEGNQFVAISS